uniref:CRC domain-containing protein n=1 Tax=Timema poppense TaxID=170557 RepID=A0A7R9CQI3_TIMPO|nr:unnamed protein product [Timema poppensis]
MSAHTGLRMPIVYCFSLGGAELEPWSLGSVENKSSRNVYCDCFANGEFCHMCNCNNCYNNLEHEEDRQRAIKSCLERNSNAFRPKIGKGVVGDERRHNKGCNCKRSGCLKNYCECYENYVSEIQTQKARAYVYPAKTQAQLCRYRHRDQNIYKTQ